MLLLPAGRCLNTIVPNLGFGGKTVGFGPIFRAGSIVGLTTVVALLLSTGGVVATVATGNAATTTAGAATVGGT